MAGLLAASLGRAHELTHQAYELTQEAWPQHPVCPDCGAEWDFDSANEEEGETFGGQHVISVSAWCSAYDADEEASREPAPHPLTDGMAEFELNLA